MIFYCETFFGKKWKDSVIKVKPMPVGDELCKGER